MKIAVAVFVALAAPLCLAAPQGYNYASPAPAPAPTPAPAAYNYAYSVGAVDGLGRPVQFGHQEGREGDATAGRYFVVLSDGRLMTVDYYADQTGFHPTYSFQAPAGVYAAPGQASEGRESTSSWAWLFECEAHPAQGATFRYPEVAV
nr:cuticle protein 21-like [Penaeus vannamei]